MRLIDLTQIPGGARMVGRGDLDPTGVFQDSRCVEPGAIYACLVGATHDGHGFAADAIARGAAALLVDEGREGDVPSTVPVLIVPSVRAALPWVAAAVYGCPAAQMRMVGVTGTNGKTTTARFAAGILNAAGEYAGTIGTLGAELRGRVFESEHTTPEADQLQRVLSGMHGAGATAVAMEVSSHAIALERSAAIPFESAIFTNLTQDHLDFHGDLDSYFAAKLRLFTEYAEGSGKPFAAAVNLDDPRGEAVAAAVRGNAVTYGREAQADLRAVDVRLSAEACDFVVRHSNGGTPVHLNVGGAFQVYNALGAAAACSAMGVDFETIAAGLASVACVPGRFEQVPGGSGFSVIVDYAHTPDGLENVLRAARDLGPRRLITVFGCGGNRDRRKRPIMGGIAGRLSDFVVVTSDNPRREDPDAIIEEILPGLRGTAAVCRVESERRAAIAVALAEAGVGDIVVIAGKGHESGQIVGDTVLPFDDRVVAREVLTQMAAAERD